MRKVLAIALVVLLLLPGLGRAATVQQIDLAIDAGLANLASTQVSSGSEGYWSYGYNGTLAATASAALAFIEEGHTPGGGTPYDAVVTKAVNYVFNRAKVQGGGVYFDPANIDRTIYTTGIVAPVIFALGKANPDAVITVGSVAINGLTYRQAMQEVMDWYAWGQNGDGGWRYRPNSGGSDNSTAQWGALPFLYGREWGLSTPATVVTGLTSWTNQVQNTVAGHWREGGSGYTNPDNYVNMAKTAGLLLEFAVMGLPESDPRVAAALAYIQSTVDFDHWNQNYFYNGSTASQWHGGNMGNPYSMWAIYKALDVYGKLHIDDNGTPLDDGDDFYYGSGVATAPGGITIGQDWATKPSLAGDWYSHYADYLVGAQGGSGGWSGNGPWTGALATGWYINILNATGAPPPVTPVIPEPGSLALVAMGVAGFAIYLRRRRKQN